MVSRGDYSVFFTRPLSAALLAGAVVLILAAVGSTWGKQRRIVLAEQG